MAKKSIQELVYDELKRNIISLHLKPGQAMSTQEIATKLNVSRTPVREAFLQLQSENLITMIPQKETVVSKINRSYIEQEKFIRECLEMGVIDIFLKKRSSSDIRRMAEFVEAQKRFVAEKDPVGFVEADDLFHKVLFEATGQEMAWDTISGKNGHYKRFRILFVQTNDVAESSVRQHAEIVRLLEQGEDDLVRNALKAHIQRLDIDNSEVIRSYADYFESEDENPQERRIGTL
ncbi:MAG: GntR family transcriptional regulator [Clostridiales bacterium]|nr:GntR family transcriptional regulator [Candidatus Blautia equi]